MYRTHSCRRLIVFALLLLNGCAGLAVHATSSFVPSLTRTFFEECDLELARQSLPAQLKLMEGLLAKAPKNREFLTALCMGFAGYAMMFVEDEDPERASRLYQRAMGYGFRAIGMKSATPEALMAGVKRMRKAQLEPLFWVALSWHAWIHLNLDKPAALGELGAAQACLDRVMELNPDFFFGTPYLIAGAMQAARPQMLGGDADKAREYFSKGMAVTDGAFFLAPYYYAKYYAVRIQDKALFLDLIQGVEKGRPDRLKEVCLINTAAQQKMKGLKERADDLFF